MKKIAALVAVIVAASVASASAAQPVKSSVLNKMGLNSMKTMSDAEGMTVRGKGALVFGVSYAKASFYGSTAVGVNGYVATGHHVAAGLTVSGAAVGPATAIAGGFSIAGGH